MATKKAKVTTEIVDANGNPIIRQYEVTYDPTVTEVVCELEHVKQQDGGPLMRPKNPRY